MKSKLASKIGLLLTNWNQRLEEFVLRQWERLTIWNPSFIRRVFVLSSMAGLLFLVSMLLYVDQEFYYPIIMILAASAMAFYDGTLLGVLFAIITSLAFDYLVVPPVHSILSGPTSKAVFLICAVIGVLISFLVSSLRIAFRKVSLIKNRLAAAVKARDEMIAIISHELKNPITALQLGLAWIKVDLSQKGDQKKLLGLVNNLSLSVGRMKNLVEDLVNVARIQSKALHLDLAPFNLVKIVEDVVSGHEFEVKNKVLQLTVHFNPDTPLIYGDSVRTFQILSNLVSNAIKFTEKGGSISIFVSKKQSEIEVEVRDSGKGISEEDGLNLFIPFSQAKGDTTQGTGLGLYIAKGLVEGQGGRIWFKSNVGFGTSFYFTLPIAELDEQLKEARKRVA